MEVLGAEETAARLPYAELAESIREVAALIVGAGTRARSHLKAFHEGLGVSQVFLTSRTTERAEARETREEPGYGSPRRGQSRRGVERGEPRGHCYDEPGAGAAG